MTGRRRGKRTVKQPVIRNTRSKRQAFLIVDDGLSQDEEDWQSVNRDMPDNKKNLGDTQQVPQFFGPPPGLNLSERSYVPPDVGPGRLHLMDSVEAFSGESSDLSISDFFENLEMIADHARWSDSEKNMVSQLRLTGEAFSGESSDLSISDFFENLETIADHVRWSESG